MSRAEVQRVYRNVEELPEVLEPGKYVVEGEELVVYELVSREEITNLLQKTRRLLERYGGEGWA